MKYIRNEIVGGIDTAIYEHEGRTVYGPSSIAKPPTLTRQEQFDLGLITQKELGILGREVSEIEQLQLGKIK